MSRKNKEIKTTCSHKKLKGQGGVNGGITIKRKKVNLLFLLLCRSLIKIKLGNEKKIIKIKKKS